jgi:PAS domain S-box-containing protein
MLERLDRWSRIGVPDFGGDFNKARAANALNIVLMGLSAITLVGAFGIVRYATTRLIPELIAAATLTAALLILIVTSHQLMRRGRVQLASQVLLVGLWLIFSVRIALSGGYRSPGALSYALLCTIAGLLLGWRAAFAALVMCGFALMVLLGVEVLGYDLPNILMTAQATVLVSYSTSLVVFTVMLAFAWTRQTMDEAVSTELQFRQVIEQAADCVYVTDAAGKILMANAAACAMFGYSAKEMTRLHASDTYVSEERDLLAERLRRLVAGERLRYERVAQRKDGTTVPVEVTGSRLSDGRLHAILRDISDRKRAEAELRESEDRFRRLADAGFEGIAVTEGGRIVDTNARLAEMFGYAPGELVGFNVIDAVAPQDRERVANHIRSGSPEAYEHLAIRKDGTKIQVQVQGRMMPFRGANVRITAIRDITERLALEDRLRQSQKMEAVGQLAGGVAHDFNNLLMVIGTQAELLHMDDAIPADSREGVAEIMDAVKRAGSLTQQLLTLSRRKVIQAVDIDVNESVTRTTQMLRRVIPEDIVLDVHCAPQPLPIRADQGMLDQVLINLAVNARDALAKGGRITVSTSLHEIDAAYVRNVPQARPGSFVCLTVADNGSGIQPAVLPRIFEPFFTTKDVGKGTGLGLATVDGIVAQHSGWITVESTVGKGSAFRVFLPRTAMPAASAPVATDASAATSNAETILLAEDEGSVREVLKDGLERMGHRVLTARTGAEAVRQWDSVGGRIDVLVTDIVMPDGMSGWDLARDLRRLRPDLRVICMSGYSAGVSRPGGSDTEQFTFLQKPFSLADLADAMRSSAKA